MKKMIIDDRDEDENEDKDEDDKFKDERWIEILWMKKTWTSRRSWEVEKAATWIKDRDDLGALEKVIISVQKERKEDQK